MADETKREEAQRFRALHWVFRVGHLGNCMKFYQKVLGMHVLRHEEFADGCEATCNGPYGGAWSKTMIGYEPEQTGSLEITYNYGIDGYARGNDLNHIVLYCKPEEVVAAAKAEGFATKEEGGVAFVSDPDGAWYKLVDGGEEKRRLAVASINVSDLAKSVAFYTEAMEFQKMTDVAGSSEGGVVVGHAKGAMLIELNQASGAIDFKLSKGRLATETRDNSEIEVKAKAAKDAGGSVLHGPMVLPPHDEHVVIIGDPDGYEYCFVGAEGYARGSLSVTNTVIDWDARKAKGADGAEVPKIALKGPMNKMVAVADDDAYEELVAGAEDRPIVVDCMASWCKNCAKLFPTISALSAKHEGALFVKLDIDECPDAAEDAEVMKVPTLLFVRGGDVKVGRLEGSDPAAATEAVEKFLSA